MFVSHYNQLVFKFIDTFDYSQAPAVTVIAGNEGLGKTVLLDYLRQKCQQSVKDILFIDAGKFSAKYAYAACNGDLSSFRKEVRTCKLLLLDNLDKLKGKTKTIEELFHTLDTILAQGGKTVITFGGSELGWDYLGERLASRLSSGLILRLQNPTEQEIKSFIAYYRAGQPEGQRAAGKAYQLAGHAKNIRQAIDFMNMDACKIKQNSYRLNNIKDQVDVLLPLACSYFGVEEKKVLAGSKTPQAVTARYMLFLLLFEIFQTSYQEISLYFQNNLANMRRKCLQIKETEREAFETLCQKLYNQLDICN